MALGLGEGGEQNAPLGRAVIGGLIFATCATLMFVPVVFSIVHGRSGARAKRQPHAGAAVRRSLCLTRIPTSGRIDPGARRTCCATPRRPA